MMILMNSQVLEPIVDLVEQETHDQDVSLTPNLLAAISPLLTISSPLLLLFLKDTLDDTITLAYQVEQLASNLAQLVESYILIEGLEVTNKHTPYVLDNIYELVSPYMVDGISFDEQLEAIHKEALEFRVVIVSLNAEIA